MTRIYKVKNVPDVVRQWFRFNFAGSEYTFNFYTYKGVNGKTYGCEVYKNGEYYHNATQATEQWFNDDLLSSIPF